MRDVMRSFQDVVSYRMSEISLDMVIHFMEKQVAFNRHLGIKVAELRDGFARLELPFRDVLIGDPFRPALHGGCLSALADTCGGAAVYASVHELDRVSTVDLRMDYLRPGPLETIACEATVVRIGNRVGVTDMKVFAVSSPGRVIATGKGVYNVRRSEPGAEPPEREVL
jgi:uncharacterized protein (TIGR00369 family)